MVMVLILLDHLKGMKMNKLQTIKHELRSPSIKQRINERLDKNAGAFTTSLIDLCSENEYLMNCNPTQIIQEALKAATLNLPINNNLGYAYIIPYKNVPQFIMGYKGYIQLCLRSGQFKHLNARTIYEGEIVTEDKIFGFVEITGEKTSDKEIGYLIAMKLITGFEKAMYWSKERVIKHASQYSKSFNSKVSPWKTDFNAMAKKTMILQLKPFFPMEIETKNIIPQDSDYQGKVLNDYDPENAEIIDIQIEENKQEETEVFDGVQK